MLSLSVAKARTKATVSTHANNALQNPVSTPPVLLVCYTQEYFLPCLLKTPATAKKRDVIMPSLGPFEIAVILIMVLILFGPGKLPQVFGALGDGMRQFKRASQGLTDEVNQTLSSQPSASAPATPTAEPESTATAPTSAY